MPGVDRAAARTVVVIVLMVLAVVALRGHLPGADPATDAPPDRGPGPLIAVVTMLVLSMAVIALSVLTQRHDPVTRPDTVGALARDRAGRGGRWTWRMAAVVAAVVVGWLVVVLLLMRLSGWLEVAAGPPAQPAEPTRAAPNAGAPEPPPPQDAPGSGAALGVLAAAAAVFVALSIAATMAGRRQRRQMPSAPFDDPPGEQAPASGPQTLVRAAERGLAEIGDLSREPREAIIACYAAMERELDKAPGARPQESDTPTEVLARAVQRDLLRADSATELVDLFEEARFSPHVMDEQHREVAVQVLRLVLHELQEAP
ncbi:DUF4129 domain-containing protein [Mycobacterium sp. PS03-16]|uniref:DUF4129 domain-containing protein n=1 Tax=Mycobacterium sp. PS03-16 TaxID=2559611 RepID=UPI0010745D00|nr:DUF4129 domain-containing protein [Mycobacterium sp. PS03-16]TFV57664.1 DUF4129 domain-containing protein [Mycobacterium sp. PS03-16]